MTDFDAAVHRTLIDYLLAVKEKELIAAIIDAELESRCYYISEDDRWAFDRYFIAAPSGAYELIRANDSLIKTLGDALERVTAGQSVPLHDPTGFAPISGGNHFRFELRMKLVTPEPGWQAVVRTLLMNPKGANQALVSDIASDGRPLHQWNELRYASASEIRIAQEFERRKVLFFPLAVAVRVETGKNWQDHREVDFLVCENGVWGILEVAYHPNRYEQDAEKDLWFKKSGVLCIQHFTAERCYNESAKVVSEFLAVLGQHKR